MSQTCAFKPIGKSVLLNFDLLRNFKGCNLQNDSPSITMMADVVIYKECNDLNSSLCHIRKPKAIPTNREAKTCVFIKFKPIMYD